jgi:hypothetical protein
MLAANWQLNSVGAGFAHACAVARLSRADELPSTNRVASGLSVTTRLSTCVLCARSLRVEQRTSISRAATESRRLIDFYGRLVLPLLARA